MQRLRRFGGIAALGTALIAAGDGCQCSPHHRRGGAQDSQAGYDGVRVRAPFVDVQVPVPRSARRYRDDDRGFDPVDRDDD